MLIVAYLIIVGLTALSLVQSFSVKEISVEAEIEKMTAAFL